MKFQLIRKYNLTWLLIAAAVLGLDYLFQAAHGKLQRAYPKHHRIKFLLAADRQTGSYYGLTLTEIETVG